MTLKTLNSNKGNLTTVRLNQQRLEILYVEFNILRQSMTMKEVFFVTFPFFALVLAGFWATYRSILPLTAITGMNAYVLYFALPCLLFRFGTSTPIASLLDPITMVIYILVGAIMVGLSVKLALQQKNNWADASLGALVAAFPNSGFMGVPLLVALFGAAAAGPVIQTIMIDMILTSSVCIALSQLGNTQHQSLQNSLMKAIQGVFSNPMPWSIGAGMLVSASRVWIPEASQQMALEQLQPLAKTIGLLADSASPVALFTIGAVLARAQLQQNQINQEIQVGHAVANTHSAWSAAIPVALLKLFLHPALLLIGLLIAKQMGFVISDFNATVLVCVAALPSASNVSLLAERFGADNGRIARIIMLSTGIAFISFSALVAFYK